MKAGHLNNAAAEPSRLPPSPRLPSEVLTRVVAEVEMSALVPLAQTSRQFRQSVAHACRSDRRRCELIHAIERSAPSAFCRTLREYAPVLDLLSGSLRLPRPHTPQIVSAAIRALRHSELRACVRVSGSLDAEQLRALPAAVDVDWSLALPLLTRPFQLPQLPANLTRLGLDVEEASAAGLEHLFSHLAPRAVLSLTIEHIHRRNRPLSIPATLQLKCLSVPAAWLHCSEFADLFRHPGITELHLSDGDDGDPHGGPLARVAPSISLRTLYCSPASFWQLEVCSLKDLRRVEFEAESVSEAVERLADLPALEVVFLLERTHDTATPISVGDALTRWPLPDSVHTLSLRTDLLDPWIRHIRWPQSLRMLTLDFCPLREGLRDLARCQSVEHLSLLCTDLEEALFHATWPQALRRLEVDLDDLPLGGMEFLHRVLPQVHIDVHDL